MMTYAMLECYIWWSRSNLQIHESVSLDAYDKDYELNLIEKNMMMGFGIQDKDTNEPKDDPYYIKWTAEKIV